MERGPEMFMDPAEEESAGKVALEESVTDAVAQGLSVSKAERLRGILSRRFNAVRRALRGDSPARVEPMRDQLKPGASAVKAKPRRYDPVKTSWLVSCVAALLAFGLVPAGGGVQSGDGGAEKGLSSLGGRLAVALGECSGFACACCGCF